jgi:hypothetical protein
MASAEKSQQSARLKQGHGEHKATWLHQVRQQHKLQHGTDLNLSQVDDTVFL